MLIDRLQLHWLSPGLLSCLTLLTVIINPVWATTFILPDDVKLRVLEEYVLTGELEGKNLDVTYKPETGSSHINFMAVTSGMGWLKLQGSDGVKVTNGTLGDLEVHVIHAEDSTLTTSGDFSVTWEHSSEHMTSSCNGKTCDERAPAEEAREHSVRAMPSSLSGSDQQLIQRFTRTDVAKSPELFKHPTVHFGGKYCTLGAPSSSSDCRSISAVIIRFVPYNYDANAAGESDDAGELAIHLLEKNTVIDGEAIMSDLAYLLSDGGKPMWKKVLDKLQPYKSKLDEEGKETGFPVYNKLPVMPEEPQDILARLKKISEMEDKVWIHGTCSGTMYCGDKNFYKEQVEAFGYFAASNSLQADMNPVSTKMQAEIVSMVADLHGGGDVQTVEAGVITNKPSGHLTPGGTYSNISAMDAFISDAREKQIKRPIILVADTVHPSIRKAGKKLNFDIIVVKTSLDTKTMPVDKVRELIELYNGTGKQSNGLAPGQVVGVVASAPGYSYGISDPVHELSELMLEVRQSGRMMHLHVDSCMGGFILPFARVLSERVNTLLCDDLRARTGNQAAACPQYNFPQPLLKYPGVSSFSADVHKYGYAIKGISVLVFREQALHKQQFYTEADWDGGASINVGMGGSSSGGLIAAAHFAMISLGLPGYLEKAADIMVTAARFQNIVRAHPELEIIGDPSMCFAFREKQGADLNIFHIADAMGEMGIPWRFNHLQNPKALHFCITGPQTQVPDDQALPHVAFRKSDALKQLAETMDAEEVELATEEKLYRMAGILDFRLEHQESRPTQMFAENLSEALPKAMANFGNPSRSGTLYGLGAVEIDVDNLVLRKALLESGLLAMLQTQGDFDDVFASTRYWTNKIASEVMNWPAY